MKTKTNRAYKYRIYPTSEQATLFAKTFGCCRKIWNLMLEDKIAYRKLTGKNLMTTPAQYKDQYPYLKEVDCMALCNVQINLQQAFRNRAKNKKFGLPKPKSKKKSRRSYTTNNIYGSVAIVEKGIKLPKAGIVRAVIHRQPEEGWKLKSATISQDRDGRYYVSVLFEFEQVVKQQPVTSETTIGLDYASDGLYVDSNGEQCNMPHYYRRSSEKLANLQRKLSRRKGSRKREVKSKNYLKQLRKVNRLHSHIAHQRKDYLHKKSTEIANRYSCVCVESLNMRQMANKGFGNGKATMDNGYGMFLNMLAYKLADRGGHLVKVSHWFPSSQLCSSCGIQHPEMKDLSIRTIRCQCGNQRNRDHNAAITIRNEGLRIVAQTS